MNRFANAFFLVTWFVVSLPNAIANKCVELNVISTLARVYIYSYSSVVFFSLVIFTVDDYGFWFLCCCCCCWFEKYFARIYCNTFFVVFLSHVDFYETIGWNVGLSEVFLHAVHWFRVISALYSYSIRRDGLALGVHKYCLFSSVCLIQLEARRECSIGTSNIGRKRTISLLCCGIV